MTTAELNYHELINEVDDEKVEALMNSIRENGFVGCPILVYGDILLTGSHRLEALRRLAAEDSEYENEEVAEDVSDIVDEALAAFEEKNGYDADIEFDNLGWMFRGTWVEDYKDEIAEW